MKRLHIGGVFQSSLSFTRGEAGHWEFSPNSAALILWGCLWSISTIHFPANLDVADFMLSWDVGASSLFSGLLEKEIGTCIIVVLESPWAEGGNRLPILPSF